jgi:hypothetical protein
LLKNLQCRIHPIFSGYLRAAGEEDPADSASRLYLWKGEQPLPDDLLHQLNDPIQIRIILSSLTEVDSLFAVGENAFGLTKEYYRKTLTLHELARILGFSAQEAKDDDRQMKKTIAYWNRRFERKRLISQERAFRERRKRDGE